MRKHRIARNGVGVRAEISIKRGTYHRGSVAASKAYRHEGGIDDRKCQPGMKSAKAVINKAAEK